MSKIKAIISKIIYNAYILNVKNLINGIIEYKRKGNNSESGYFAMLNLYCLTNGYSNAFLSWLIKISNFTYDLPKNDGVLGELNQKKLHNIVQEINTNGYYIFDNLLSPDICEKLRKFALTQETNLRPSPDIKPESTIYNPNNLLATTYWLKEENLIANPEIQALISDLSVIAVAQAYLETPPILDIVTMWWSTNFVKEACTESAQLYHFDLDRVKWLKFFIYLTDVNSQNGPHCYIKGTHKPGAKPKDLLKLGYARITDEEIQKFYPPESFVEITAPQGTIIAGDTSCFHKGKPSVEGERLVLELEFTNSLFGGFYTKSIFKNIANQNLAQLIKTHSRIFAKFSF